MSVSEQKRKIINGFLKQRKLSQVDQNCEQNGQKHWIRGVLEKSISSSLIVRLLKIMPSHWLTQKSELNIGNERSMSHVLLRWNKTEVRRDLGWQRGKTDIPDHMFKNLLQRWGVQRYKGPYVAIWKFVFDFYINWHSFE